MDKSWSRYISTYNKTWKRNENISHQSDDPRIFKIRVAINLKSKHYKTQHLTLISVAPLTWINFQLRVATIQKVKVIIIFSM